MNFKTTYILIPFLVAVKCDCPNGFVRHDDSCYSFPRIQGTWAQASIYCHAIGATLVSVETREEDIFLEGYLQNNGNSYDVRRFWLGGTDILHEKEWTWTKTGKNISAGYNNWSPGQPDNGDDNGEHCMEMEYDTHWLWNDEDCEHLKDFICEKAAFVDTGTGFG